MTKLKVNRLTERMMVAGSGFLLIGAVAAIDDGVRGRLASIVSGGGTTELSMADARLQRVVRGVTEAVGYHGTEHTTLALFAIAALVLLVLMLRA